MRSRFEGDSAFEQVTEEAERVRVFKDYIKSLKVYDCTYILYNCTVYCDWSVMYGYFIVLFCKCSEYSNIHKEFISNLDGILQNNFHLKSSLTKLNTFLTRVFGSVVVILIIDLQILRLFL